MVVDATLLKLGSLVVWQLKSRHSSTDHPDVDHEFPRAPAVHLMVHASSILRLVWAIFHLMGFMHLAAYGVATFWTSFLRES